MIHEEAMLVKFELLSYSVRTLEKVVSSVLADKVNGRRVGNKNYASQPVMSLPLLKFPDVLSMFQRLHRDRRSQAGRFFENRSLGPWQELAFL